MAKQNKNHTWTFQRIGGLEQVRLQTASDIIQLPTLDPKLWVALSCPTSGLEFNKTILTLLDQDSDQRIRVADIKAAVSWLRPRLKKFEDLIQAKDGLSLSDINSDTAEGKRIATTIGAIMAVVGKKKSEVIYEADLIAALTTTTNSPFDGDGILSVSAPLEGTVIHFIKDAISVIGGVKNSKGEIGINNEIARAFINSLTEWFNWRQKFTSVPVPFKSTISEAWQLFVNLKDKIDDYFLRSQLASYAPQAEIMLNVNERYIVPTDNRLLDQQTLLTLPLSRIIADRPLDLKSALNPAWKMDIERFGTLIKPFLRHPGQLFFDEWQQIKAWLTPYTEAAKSKPTPVSVAVAITPTSTIDALGEKRVAAILNSDIADKFAQLVEEDCKAPAIATDAAEVHRLIIYQQHLYRLLLNFVSFDDFFAPHRQAIFQSGQLYIDGRCCTLCVPVTDIVQHTTLANYSELFLLYCRCIRKQHTGNNTLDKMEIVAAVTAGDADFLLNGRNGLFIDNNGDDWDATVINVIVKPISIPQAIWRPYKQFIRFITTQINKSASAKNNALLNSVVPPGTSTAGTTATKFDLSKNMGIFAAIGLAIGAIGTVLATILHALLQLSWWQIPLVFLAIFLLISGLSVVIAALKLSQRTLGPLLEASGWAINGKIKINFSLGKALTSKAKLPDNAQRQQFNSVKKRHFGYRFIVGLVIIVATVSIIMWHNNLFHPPKSLIKKFEKLVYPTPTNHEQPPSIDQAPTTDKTAATAGDLSDN